jgi:glucosamine--fructose-6-phosphate aminotransferase (isomerizing)
MDENALKSNAYVSDILSQPEALRSALDCLDLKPVEALRARWDEFDRILLTGMGASLYGAYPAWLHLARSGLPAVWVDTAELLHYARAMITGRTLVWVISQSGRSAEMVALLEHLRRGRAGALLVTANDLDSPLARAADLGLPMCAGSEQAVSTRTYINTLAVTQLGALALCDQDLAPHLRDLEHTLAGMRDYLADWETHLHVLGSCVGMPRHLYLLGRGPSLACVHTGALVIQEAAKCPTVGMQAAQFRHGPLEVAGSDLTAVLLAGRPETAALNRRLFDELRGYGSRAFWLDEGESAPAEGRLGLPPGRGIGLPLVEMLPLQLLSVHLAWSKGIVPGEFRYGGKVTLTE